MAEGWGLPQSASAYLAAGSLERSLSGGDDDEDKAGAAATQAIRFAEEFSPQGESIVLRAWSRLRTILRPCTPR